MVDAGLGLYSVTDFFFFFLQASVYFSVGEGFVLIENSESLTVLQLRDLFNYI